MNREEIGGLTGLRGVAALWVFLFHAGNFAKRIGSDAVDVLPFVGGAGFLGVDVFFVLSGFILAHNYGSANLIGRPAEYFRFLWKRLARIYPVHVWALGLLILLQLAFASFGSRLFSPSHLSWDGLWATLTLTHAWSIPIERTWNTVSWSISSEWAAYLAFPFIAAIATKLRSKAAILAVVVALFLCLSLSVAQSSHGGTMAYGMPRVAVGFSAGVLIYRLWLLRGKERTHAHASRALLALVLLVPFGNILSLKIGPGSTLLVLPILACGLVYGLAAGEGRLCRVLSSRLGLYAGHISYSFYMVHGLVFASFAAMLRGTDLGNGLGSGLAVICLIFFVTWLLADLTYRLCEVPARRQMLTLFARESASRSSGNHEQREIEGSRR